MKNTLVKINANYELDFYLKDKLKEPRINSLYVQ